MRSRLSRRSERPWRRSSPAASRASWRRRGPPRPSAPPCAATVGELGDDLGGALARHDRDAVLVADEDVAGVDGHAADDDRKADLARPVLERRVRRQAAREDRHADLVDAVDVAHHAVGDAGDDALVARHAEQDVADDRRLLVVAGLDHHHVARLRIVDRRIRREVVARPAAHGQRHAGERGGRGERPDAVVDRALAAHGVDDPADGDAGQRLHMRRDRAAGSCGGRSVRVRQRPWGLLRRGRR